jgi:hypothetical protein
MRQRAADLQRVTLHRAPVDLDPGMGLAPDIHAKPALAVEDVEAMHAEPARTSCPKAHNELNAPARRNDRADSRTKDAAAEETRRKVETVSTLAFGRRNQCSDEFDVAAGAVKSNRLDPNAASGLELSVGDRERLVHADVDPDTGASVAVAELPVPANESRCRRGDREEEYGQARRDEESLPHNEITNVTDVAWPAYGRSRFASRRRSDSDPAGR